MSVGTAVDCVGHPSPVAVLAAGHQAIACYVGIPSRRKCVTAAQVAAYLAAGLQLILVYEDTTGSWTGGRGRGLADGQAVRAHLTILGLDWAQVACVYMAFDEDVTADELPTARDYAAGVAQAFGGPGKVGGYGGRVVLADLLDRGLIGRAWAAAGWQYGRIDARCVMAQHVQQVNVGGVPCDVNDLRAEDFGQYPAVDAPPSARRASEDAVALLSFPGTPPPADPPAGRWQDTDPATWPRSPELCSALVPAVAGGWRGRGSVSSIACGWAGGQDPGSGKPSGFIAYLRVFHFTDLSYSEWLATDLVKNAPLVGNRSLPQAPLPEWCTLLVVRYAAPAGLFLGVEWEH